MTQHIDLSVARHVHAARLAPDLAALTGHGGLEVVATGEGAAPDITKMAGGLFSIRQAEAPAPCEIRVPLGAVAVSRDTWLTVLVEFEGAAGHSLSLWLDAKGQEPRPLAEVEGSALRRVAKHFLQGIDTPDATLVLRLPRVAGLIEILDIRVLTVALADLTRPASAWPEADIRGAVEGKVSAPFVKGWCYDANDPTRKLVVDLYAADILIDSQVANKTRDDLRASRVGDGRYGFWFDLSHHAFEQGRVPFHVVLRDHPDAAPSGKIVYRDTTAFAES